MTDRRVKSRLWEVDALRGVAIVLMVAYHALWDLHFFGLTSLDVGTGGWLMFARGIGTLFLLLAGVSLTLERSRRLRRSAGGGRVWRRAVRRGMKIFGWGVVITLVTRLAIPSEYVRFGILHLIGVAVMLSPAIVPLGVWNAPFGALVGLGGFLLGRPSVSAAWGIPFGMIPGGVSMVDYYPIFPWLGVVMIGVAVGTSLYPGGERRYAVPAPDVPAVSGLSIVGRHSLTIYLAHQPVLLSLLAAVRRLVL